MPAGGYGYAIGRRGQNKDLSAEKSRHCALAGEASGPLYLPDQLAASSSGPSRQLRID